MKNQLIINEVHSKLELSAFELNWLWNRLGDLSATLQGNQKEIAEHLIQRIKGLV